MSWLVACGWFVVWTGCFGHDMLLWEGRRQEEGHDGQAGCCCMPHAPLPSPFFCTFCCNACYHLPTPYTAVPFSGTPSSRQAGQQGGTQVRTGRMDGHQTAVSVCVLYHLWFRIYLLTCCPYVNSSDLFMWTGQHYMHVSLWSSSIPYPSSPCLPDLQRELNNMKNKACVPAHYLHLLAQLLLPACLPKETKTPPLLHTWFCLVFVCLPHPHPMCANFPPSFSLLIPVCLPRAQQQNRTPACHSMRCCVGIFFYLC